MTEPGGTTGATQRDLPHDTVGLADTLTGDLRPVRRAALGLGSNLGDRLETLQGAIDSLSEAPDTVAVAVSGVYECVPVGGPPDQGDYLNVVLVLETALAPRDLLERAQSVEDAFGRTREVQWGPRTLDVDLLAVGGVQVDEPDLRVPHPRAAERAFVLAPWREVDPEFVVPGAGRVADLAERVDGSGVRLRPDVTLQLPD